MGTWSRETQLMVAQALRQIAEGYPIEVLEDRYIVVDSSATDEEVQVYGKDPKICLDLHNLTDKPDWEFSETIKLCSWVFDCISRLDFDPIIKEIVYGVDSHLTDHAKLVAILRFSYHARSQIKSYPRLVEFVRKYLEDRGAPADSLLRGLDK